MSERELATERESSSHDAMQFITYGWYKMCTFGPMLLNDLAELFKIKSIRHGD